MSQITPEWGCMGVTSIVTESPSQITPSDAMHKNVSLKLGPSATFSRTSTTCYFCDSRLMSHVGAKMPYCTIFSDGAPSPTSCHTNTEQIIPLLASLLSLLMKRISSKYIYFISNNLQWIITSTILKWKTNYIIHPIVSPISSTK